jgi:hypothetical protein
MLKIDGHDNAILGPAYIWRGNSQVEVLVYDAEVIRGNLMMESGMESEEAREFIEFNIEGAYMGEGTPIIVWTQDMWDHDSDD